MYIRKKVAKGHTYWQIVEGRREGGKVRQHVLCSLGTERDPGAVLKWKKHQLAQRRRDLKQWAPILSRIYRDDADRSAKNVARLQTRIDALARDVAAIGRFLEEGKMVGTTKSE